jgi:hypothetical protein
MELKIIIQMIFIKVKHLNLRIYVDISGPQGYKNLIDLMEKKLKSASVKYEIDVMEKEKNIVSSNVDKPEPKGTVLNSIPSMNLDGKEINYFNHNYHSDVKFSFDIDITDNETNNETIVTDKNNEKYYDFENLKKLEKQKLDKFKNFLSNGIKNKIFNLEKYFQYQLRECYSMEESDNLNTLDTNNYILTPKKMLN